MIREWTLEDAKTNRLAVFMKAFEQATSFVKVDSNYTHKVYLDMMTRGVARLFIAETDDKQIQGAIGFIVSKDFHEDVKIAIETFWFVDPTYRGIGKELFNVFEATAKEMGCKKLAMIHLADSYPDSLEAFYLKNGYKLLEKHYVKAV
jgi:GNAT superfamily N-acetyltransferase